MNAENNDNFSLIFCRRQTITEDENVETQNEDTSTESKDMAEERTPSVEAPSQHTEPIDNRRYFI